MVRYLILFLSLINFSSCKVQTAYFQESSTPNVHPKVKKKSFSNIRQISAKHVSPLKIEIKQQKIEILENSLALPILISPEPLVHPVQTEKMSFEKPSADHFIPKQKEKPKPKKKGKKFRQISSNLFVGFVFLGIAIVLAFLKLPSLVILFGLASIIFLAIGLKKIWKKKRRQSRFKDIFRN